jgi:hypothetical protein
MPLQGEAKKLYQRKYMRKLRAGLPTAKPRPPKRPPVKPEQRKRPPPRCMFCTKPASAKRILVGDGFTHICERCVTKASHVIRRSRASRPPQEGVRLCPR